jgi:hypothetical protein
MSSEEKKAVAGTDRRKQRALHRKVLWKKKDDRVPAMPKASPRAHGAVVTFSEDAGFAIIRFG